MFQIDNIHSDSTREDVINILCVLFKPYALELINSGADFSYMNMYADNFKEELFSKTKFDEFEVFEILNEACDLSWKSI